MTFKESFYFYFLSQINFWRKQFQTICPNDRRQLSLMNTAWKNDYLDGQYQVNSQHNRQRYSTVFYTFGSLRTVLYCTLSYSKQSRVDSVNVTLNFKIKLSTNLFTRQNTATILYKQSISFVHKIQSATALSLDRDNFYRTINRLFFGMLLLIVSYQYLHN